MAKRLTFAVAKEKIKELEAQVKNLVDDAALNTDDNIYDKGEQKFIKIYKYGFHVLLILNILQFVL